MSSRGLWCGLHTGQKDMYMFNDCALQCVLQKVFEKLTIPFVRNER
jgi:hypothetical protein